MQETVGKFIFRRLYEAGCHHGFGIPGDYVLGLMNNMLKSDVKLISTCNELNAAYAADCYARLRGIGLCVTTYAVGELSAINGIAGAFAESVPVVKLTGAPAREHFTKGTLLHHTLGDYSIPRNMFAMVTASAIILNNPDTVVETVDAILSVCLRRSLPVYMAVCADIVEEVINTPSDPFLRPQPLASDPAALAEAVEEATNIISASQQPMVLPGLDLIRFSLRSEFSHFINHTGLPYATMILGKGVLDEEHPQFIGLYQGNRSREYVKKRIDEADVVVIFGERMTDFNTGGFSCSLQKACCILAESNHVQIKHHTYHQVSLRDFIVQLTARLKKRTFDIIPASAGCTHRRSIPYHPKGDAKITLGRLFDRVAHFLPVDSVLIAETGSSLFSATECMLPKGSRFIAQTFYGSIGFTVGATLGASIARPERRVVAFIGDGSFQVTAQDLSTMIRYRCRPVIFLINNDGYLIERVIVDREYNDIQPWKYRKLPDVFGNTHVLSFTVSTESDLEKVLEAAEGTDKLVFVEVFIGKWDCNEALRAAGRQMAINNRLLEPGE